MDPNIYILKLSEAEKAVEYTVRGLTDKTSDAQQILINSLVSEFQDELLKPKESHVKSNPEVEILHCITRYEELSQATTEQGVSPTEEFITIALVKTLHYKDRIKRLINSFGDINNLSNVHSNIRRIYNWYFKLYQEKTNLAGQGAISKTSLLQPHNTSSPYNQARNSNKDKTTNPGKTFDARSRILVNEGLELRESVADFFNKIDSNRVNTQNDYFHQPLEFSSHQFEQERYTNRASQLTGERNNFPERTVRLPDNLRPAPQLRLDNLYKVKQRWNLSFDGTESNNVHDFIYRLEAMAKDDGYPEAALTRVLHFFLSKKADDWYWIFKIDNPDSSWPDMKKAMISYFSSFDFEEEIREQILRRHQGNKETFSDFALSVKKLNARLPNRLSEREILYRLCQNMLPALRNVTLPAQHLIRTVDELRVLCQRYEQMWDQTGYDPRRFSDNQFKRRQINELCHDLHHMNIGSHSRESQQEIRNSSTEQSIGQVPTNYAPTHTLEAIQKFNNRISKTYDQTNTKLVCWNCKDMGHRYQDCKQEFLDIFCFGCGQANVRIPNCTNCLRFSTENTRPSVNGLRLPHSGRDASPLTIPRETTNRNNSD